MSPAVQQLELGEWETRVRDYLAFRNRMGFSLRTAGVELKSFARHLEVVRHTGPLTTEVAIRWARLPINAKPEYWAWRLHAVRVFAQHLAATDARHEVPPSGALGRSFTRAHPHIYTPEEVGALLEETRSLSPVRGLPPHTYRTFFGLLASTGLRCGEALALRREHVDLKDGRLLIVKAKLGKTRALPLHPTTVEALRAYARRRDATFRKGRKSDAFFLSRRATALTYQRVTLTFEQLRLRLGWHRLNPIPRVHDLRHTFAVRNLLRWCEAGENVDGKIISLSVYLGHVRPTCTYWYFSAIPELMAVAGRRFEAHARAGGNR
jgi:integrase